MKRLFFTLLFVLCLSNTFAYDFESNGFYYNVISLADQTAELTCKGEENSNAIPSYSGDISIPKTTEYANKTFTVTRINDYAFFGCSIGTLTIPETIESIGWEWPGLFGEFNNLIIEDSDKPIECLWALIDGDVKDSVYLGREIEGSVVYEGGSYKTITFGPKLTTVPANCCENCINLKNVTLPDNITKIEDRAFYSWNNYRGTSSLLKISGKNVIELGASAFEGCAALESFDFPNLRIINEGCFSECTSLKDVILPSGVIDLYSSYYDSGGAFYNCSSLESISLPSTISKIGNSYEDPNFGTTSYCFAGCSALKSISIANPKPIDLDENNFNMMTYLTATLNVPVGAKEAYSKVNGWKNFSNIEEDPNLIADKWALLVSSGYGGKVEFLDKSVSNYNEVSEVVTSGDIVTLNFIPDEGYCVESVSVDGTDMTSSIVDNKMDVTITGNTRIKVYFKTKPEDPIYLTIKSADNGYISFKADRYETYSFVISPSQGWSIESVSFNGDDVTSQLTDNKYTTPEITANSELNVVYKQTAPSAVKTVGQASSIRVSASNGTLSIGNKGGATSVSVFSIDGSKVISESVGIGTTTIELPTNKVYIVKVGTETFKVSL